MTNNKRRFKRIQFSADATLVFDDESQRKLTGRLTDISLKGALLKLDQELGDVQSEYAGELTLTPEQGDISLQFHVSVAYVVPEKRLVGVNILSLDVDSAAHLKRLIEVNLGNSDDLQRELSHLIDAMEEEHGA